ncbi:MULTISPECIES: FAD-binding protein [unclassified Modicisalibacter]|uniref:electron transfer flavoprotein subunit alpha/FixB family protein n=1 Tax=unclassified Modicisalibacter TaxID=2679913 RepID=UPI001CD0302D|nr:MULTISPECIES: FAD-binding protein [unclassified Modicisalibacter]MBZ9558507.1 FAD-binding protein [Modicisalibacter sp. R2A 31.J]MBZ9575601.1 FAD-binding protein [Modicisalibacter sp. MOD 31.J]
MTVLLVAEIVNGELHKDATARAVTAASRMGDDVTVLVAGENVAEATEQAARLEGVARVVQVDDARYAHGLAEPLSELLVAMADGVSHVVAPATTAGKNVLPRVAALLDVMVVSDITDVVCADTFVRPVYAGNALQTVQSIDDIKVISVRTTAFEAAANGAEAAVESRSAAGEDRGLSRWVEDQVDKSDRPDLTSARVVVSGGRGVGSRENFAVLDELAGKLGAAVGASRAAVDAGFAPNDWQVGQTGKVVAPELYIACGISGAIQHLAGMKDSKIIVAINKDEEAPIFQVADYGLVGDLFDVVPELAAKLG